jgi:hypothetical protein
MIQRRKPLKRKVYRIKPCAIKRVVEWGLYVIAREKYLEEHPLCECGCGRHADVIHHKKGKSGKLLYNEKFFMAVAENPCHKNIEKHPAWAREMGYSVSRLSK